MRKMDLQQKEHQSFQTFGRLNEPLQKNCWRLGHLVHMAYFIACIGYVIKYSVQLQSYLMMEVKCLTRYWAFRLVYEPWEVVFRGGMKEWQLLSGFIVWFAYAFAYSCLHAAASSWHCRLIGDCEHDPDVSTLWWTADLSGVSTAPLIRVSHYWTGGVGSERPP